MKIQRHEDAASFITADSSQIREFLNPGNSLLKNQSLAEATLASGKSTTEHYHPLAEEIYFILKGQARMRVEGQESEMGPGDSVAIPNGHKHKIWNIGEEPLVFLCCCAPGYSHEDTVLVEEED
jgi:mannose-6-phosphate isomerase-like protein (cupin superfamily)